MNMDSLSDGSERNQNSHNSDQMNDAHMVAESKVAQLQEQNVLLTKENAELKAQLDQANNITTEIEKINELNRQLTSEVHQSKSDKEDLQKRFEILQKSNEDLAKKVEEEKQHSANARKQYRSNAEKEIKKVKNQYKSQVNDFCEQIEALQSKNDKSEIELKTVINKIEKLLSNAKRYFNQEFQDIDTLSSYLAETFTQSQPTPKPKSNDNNYITTPIQNRTAPATPIINQSSTQISNFGYQQAPNTVTQLEKKLKHEKSRTKVLVNSKDELELSIARLKREINEINNRHQMEITNLNNQAKKQSEEQALTDANTQHTIQSLENKIEVLTRKNEELKKKVQEAESAMGISPSTAPISPQGSENFQNQQTMQQQQLSFVNENSHQQFQNSFRNSPDKASQNQFVSNQTSQPAYYSPLLSPQRVNSSTPLTNQSSRSISSTTPRRTTFQENDENFHNCASTEHLVNQNIDLNEQVKSMRNRCNDLTERLKKSEAQRNELEILLEKEKGENQSIQIIHSNTVSELEMMREALHMKESVKDRNDKKMMRRELNEGKAQLESATQQLESIKKQLSESIAEHQKALASITNLNREIEDLKEEKSRLLKESDELKEELSTVQAELESRIRNEVTPESLLPLSSWQCHDFPNEINSGITKIASNSSLQPASKLKSIYKIIARKYAEMIKARDKALNESIDENQSIKNVINEFISDLTIALEMKPINVDEFFSSNPQKSIIEAIKTARNCHDELKRSNDQLTQTLNKVHQTFGAAGLTENGNDINGINSIENITQSMEREINTIKNQLTSTSDQLQKKNKRCKEVSLALKKLKMKADNDAEDAKQEIKRLGQVSSQLTKENEDLEKLNQKLKWDLQKITTEFDDYKQAQEEEAREMDEKIESQNKLHLLEKQRIEANYKEQIRMISEQCNDTSDFLTENQEQLVKLKQELEAQKAITAQREIEIEQLKDENEVANQDHDVKNIDEKKNIISSYEKAVAEQKQQCESHRFDVEKVSKQLAATEKKLKALKEQLFQVKKEKVNMEFDFKNQIEQLERQKKLLENSAKIDLSNAQAQFNTKIQEETSKFDEEKRRIYATIADTFRQFLSVGASLNEKSFKSTIFKARDEIARLTALDNSVRRLVNAEPTQKTDEAVAILVINQSK